MAAPFEEKLVPSVSKKQEKFMQAVVNNPKFAKKVGVPQSVGKEFTKSGGGAVKKDSKAMAKKEISFMQKKGAPKSMIKHEKEEYGMKKGGKAYAGGGRLNVTPPPARVLRGIGMKDVVDNPRVAPPTPARPAPRAMKTSAAGRMPMMKSGGLAAGHKAADGIAKKGKTKGMEVKMAGNKRMMGGGKC
jgi:hypothetical protein